jgi:small subunit ribosomal protein S8
MDKVGDLLIRIKNGYLASRKEVVVSYSKLAVAICELLKKEGYIEEYKVTERVIAVTLRYSNRTPVLTEVKRVSKPSRRIYKGSSELPRVLNGLGLAIISTPKGIMTDKEARKLGVGGEVMAYVW